MPTIVVEDGTGVASANSFASLATADQYQSDRGRTTWASAATADRESAMIRAMSFMWSLPWKGKLAEKEQATPWPRVYVYDDDRRLWDDAVVPTRVIYGFLEAAYRELTAGTLLPDLDRGGAIKRKKVDVLETEWFQGAPAATTFQEIEAMLSAFLYSSWNMELIRG